MNFILYYNIKAHVDAEERTDATGEKNLKSLFQDVFEETSATVVAQDRVLYVYIVRVALAVVIVSVYSLTGIKAQHFNLMASLEYSSSSSSSSR